MKQALLILSVLGMGIAQTSGAAETTFQPNNTLSHTSPISLLLRTTVLVATSIAPIAALMFLAMTRSVKPLTI